MTDFDKVQHAMTKLLLEFRLNEADSFKDKVLPVLKTHLNNEFVLKLDYGTKTKNWFFLNPQGDVSLTIRTRSMPNGKAYLGVIDVDFDVENQGVKVHNAMDQRRLTADLKKVLNPLEPLWEQIPPLKMGHRFNQYHTTFDGRVMEYKWLNHLYEAKSPFQHIEVIETLEHGKMLVLDADKNISEIDTESYTHMLMGLPEEKAHYAGAQVLILGGGDGNLLKEILELDSPPEFVTQIDIDDMVLKTCSKYLPMLNAPYLEQREGKNFKVNIGDAFPFMRNLKAEGKEFDIIISDLTTIPLEGTGMDDNDILPNIIDLALTLVKRKTGILMTHCNARSRPDILGRFESMIRKFQGGQVDFKKTDAFVPCFMETWTYYKLYFK